MSGSYLLDTSAVIALFAEESTLKAHLEGMDEVFVPSIVLGELYYGARKSRKPDENAARIDAFAANNVVLSCDEKTARRYGDVKEALRRKGRPIPENDVWIAAMALQNDMTLVARDVHFGVVDGLRVEAW